MLIFPFSLVLQSTSMSGGLPLSPIWIKVATISLSNQIHLSLLACKPCFSFYHQNSETRLKTLFPYFDIPLSANNALRSDILLKKWCLHPRTCLRSFLESQFHLLNQYVIWLKMQSPHDFHWFPVPIIKANYEYFPLNS